jgi:hypothetical protein
MAEIDQMVSRPTRTAAAEAIEAAIARGKEAGTEVENPGLIDETLSGWAIPRSFMFARGVCLAAAVAVAVLTLLLAPANAAPSAEQPAAGASLEFNKEDGTLYIDWSGPIVASTADDLRAALGKFGTTLNRVVLFLDSAGGQVDDGDRVIDVLNEDQTAVPAHHCGAPRQAVCVHVHTDLPPRRGPSCGTGKHLALPRGRPTPGKRRIANRHGGDGTVVPQILRPRRCLYALAQKYRAHDQRSRPVANRR